MANFTTMNHNELIAAISKKAAIDTQQAEDLLDCIIGIFSDSLVEGNSVGIQGFGIFETRQKNERLSVHPKTGVRSMIPPKLVLNFKQSSTLKEKINNNYERQS